MSYRPTLTLALSDSDRIAAASDPRPITPDTTITRAACVIARYGMPGDLDRYLSRLSPAARLDACRAIAADRPSRMP